MKHFFLLFAAPAVLSAPAFAQPAHDHSQHAAPPAQAAAPAPAVDHAAMGHGAMAAPGEHPTGLLGGYPMTRDASGTSWQPDLSPPHGGHSENGGWSLMGHASLYAVVSRQGGPRGDDKGFLAGMVMGSARRDLDDGGVLNLRAMISPDPLMGKRGYPLLLAAGETADGREHLVDRQHPHDLFMELSASYSRQVTARDSLFVYAGLPGEPAFGPPAFMHRLSAMDSPEAPITHHWLDSTHITFGVLTGGWVHENWKLEVSRFTGREPDQHRYDIETPKMDSSAARLSWNPSANWALQTSWAELESPEALEPEIDETRWSASAIYSQAFGRDGLWSVTAAWGRKRRTGGDIFDGLALEAALRPNADWTLFARAERIETDELDAHDSALPGAHAASETVAKASVGAIRDWRIAPRAKIGLGALVTANAIPSGLKHAYGDSPVGAMGFLRLTLQ